MAEFFNTFVEKNRRFENLLNGPGQRWCQ